MSVVANRANICLRLTIGLFKKKYFTGLWFCCTSSLCSSFPEYLTNLSGVFFRISNHIRILCRICLEYAENYDSFASVAVAWICNEHETSSYLIFWNWIPAVHRIPTNANHIAHASSFISMCVIVIANISIRIYDCKMWTFMHVYISHAYGWVCQR